jgi:hypothetical protein
VSINISRKDLGNLVAQLYSGYTRIVGSLILGGYDRSRHSNKTLLVPSTIDIIVGVQAISSTFGNGTSNTLLSSGIVATIDTNTQYLWLPRSVCDAFASTLGLTYFESADRYVLTNEAHSVLQASTPAFVFTIGTSSSGGANITINIPYAAFDLQAGYPIFGAPTNYFPLRRAANDSQYTLGRAFLQEVYLSVDWERDVFNISQAVFSSPPRTQEIVTIEPKNSTNNIVPRPSPTKPTLSTGAIAGVSISAIFLLALLSGFVWWVYRRIQLTKKDGDASQSLPTDDEKKDPDNLVPNPPAGLGADFELEGRMVEEMYAPHGRNEMHGGQKQPEQGTDIVEADTQSPIYELPSPDQHPSRENV